MPTTEKVSFKTRYKDTETNRVDRLIYLCKGDRKFLKNYKVRADGRISSVDIKFQKSETLIKFNRQWIASMVSSDGTFFPDRAIDAVRSAISKAEVVFSKKRKRKNNGLPN
tara:strand:- start:1234 stop:1566 length:333 start_codon:yes stop_codon:yes gene_type:complete